MRTTIELPDELLTRAKIKAAQQGITLKQLFVLALEAQTAAPRKVQGPLPTVPIMEFRPVELTPEEIDEAAFG